MIKRAAGSDEFIRLEVDAKEFGVKVDPTTFTVKIAFADVEVAPSAGDYGAATWENETLGARVIYYARRKIPTTLPADVYDLWIDLTTPDEHVKAKAGQLLLY